MVEVSETWMRGYWVQVLIPMIPNTVVVYFLASILIDSFDDHFYSSRAVDAPPLPLPPLIRIFSAPCAF
jgi:hypothetical protein